MSRQTRVARSVRAGCFVCFGEAAHWTGGQAQGTAAKHHDDTGHETWAEVEMSVRYGSPGQRAPQRRASAAPRRPAASPAAIAGFVGLPPKVRPR